MARHFFTSESVTEGHPDKVCDQISDAVLDAIMAKDPDGPRGLRSVPPPPVWCMVMGEISTTSCYVDIAARIAPGCCPGNRIYPIPPAALHADTRAVITSIDAQSPDIAVGR